MKKKLIIINGTMGVGKTATCRELNKKLKNSVWLDGDWCWMINPFKVNEENKEMVIDNITYLLKNFLKNSTIEYVIFNWVIHIEEIFEEILKPLNALDFEIIKITLTCSEEALKNRILEDVKHNIRNDDCLLRSINRLEMYKDMSTKQIDTSELSIVETVKEIVKIVK
ncbi:AAA family ATPase [Clostridium sp. YIM B02555]|uniref:AAA family ATPase n=1 Tax=Clostridium sp. YIM B02555 TaxID=2911968 RepID=UPI001EED3D5E|nr:AAA family ATPase [Clostridium sp. YIM B02555]